jgi:hypothetical protein
VSRSSQNVRFDSRTDSVTGSPEAAKLARRSYRDHWAKPKGA